MTIDKIKALITSDELRTLELKKTTGELKDGMHSLCAMLNSDGGYVIFGIAPKSLKIIGQMVTDNTRQERASPRNKSMAQVLYLTDYLERWGTGVDRIVQICKEYGVSEPEWTVTAHDVTVTFWRKKEVLELQNGENSVGNNGENKLTDRQCIICDAIKNNGNVTTKTLAVSARTIERELNFLRKEGYITKEGKSNKGVWKVLK